MLYLYWWLILGFIGSIPITIITGMFNDTFSTEEFWSMLLYIPLYTLAGVISFIAGIYIAIVGIYSVIYLLGTKIIELIRG